MVNRYSLSDVELLMNVIEDYAEQVRENQDAIIELDGGAI